MTEKMILVVEDNNIVAKDIAGRLKKLGYGLSGTARSGPEAVEKADETQPDLILMDIKLKGPMDGIEAAAQIRDLQDVPVVYLTAYADDKTLNRAKITGPFGYIVKPFDENALRTSIEIALFKHEMETRLKESEQWLATTLRCIGDATIATDTHGQIKFMNPAAEALTHWNHQETQGRPWRDVLEITDEKTGRPADSVIAGAIEDRIVTTVSEELLIVDKSGSEIPVEITAAPIIDDKGILFGMVLVFRDISERKVVEETISQNHRLLQTVLAGLSDVIFLKNMEGRYILINPAGASVLGRPEADILGRTDSELFDPATAGLLHQAQKKALSTNKVQTFETTIQSGKEKRFYLFSEEVCRSSEGETFGVIGIARDITHVKLDRQPLHQKEKLNEAGRTVGRLAHEMSESLTGIKQSFRAVKEVTEADQDYQQHLDEMGKELSRISNIAQQMSSLHWRSHDRHKRG